MIEGLRRRSQSLFRQPWAGLLGAEFMMALPLNLLAAGVVAVVAGILGHEVVSTAPTRHALTLIVVAATALLLALWLRRVAVLPVASGLALVWLVALAWTAGAEAVLATLLVAAAAAGLGSYLVPMATPARLPIAIIAGLAVMAGGIGWVLSVGVHGAWPYLLALLVIVGVIRRPLQQLGTGLVTRWSGAVGESPRLAALGVMVIGLAGTALWLPDLAYDDLAYHLALPYQLADLGYYRLDPASQVWALAPWAGDVIQAIVHVLSGVSARGAVNGLWLIVSAVLLWRLGREIGLDAGRAWLAVALFASLPMTAMLALGQQTEGPSIAVLLALALVIMRAPRPDGASLQLVAVLCGFLLALKLSNLLSAAPMVLWLLARWRGQLPWRAVPAALALFLLICGSSYAHAWLLAGNPVLPLYNDIFHSEFMNPTRFHDQRWNAGLGWDLPWRLTFASGDFFEGWPGAAGFLMVGLLGVLPLALFRPETRPLALVGLAAFLLPLLFVHYLRYAQPGLVLLLPALLGGLPQTQPRRWVNRLLGVLLILNLAFHGNVHWTLKSGALWQQIKHGRASLVEHYSPETRAAEWLRQDSLAPARILLVNIDRPFLAPFAGRAFVRNWYDREINQRATAADADASGTTWRQAWRDLGLTHVLTSGGTTAPVQAGLDAAGASVVFSRGAVRLWQLPDPGSRDLVRERNLARTHLLDSWLRQ